MINLFVVASIFSKTSQRSSNLEKEYEYYKLETILCVFYGNKEVRAVEGSVTTLINDPLEVF